MDNLLFKAGNAGPVNIDQAQGIVECFVAGIGNKDSVGDVVISGAFAKSLLRRKPRVVWGHSWNDPIGKVLEMYEVPVGDSRLPAKMRNAGIGGLYAKVQFNLNSEKGKEAFATVAFFGEEQEWSIGYKTIDSVFDPNLQANILKEVELYEVSPVLHGANQLTGTISIKADEKGQMPVIPMHGMGMPMMPQVPRIVVVAAPQEGADESSEGDPFAEGMSQELSEPDKNALQAELAERTGSKIEIMNATENSVVFRRTTTDGQASMYRLPYHREGNQYMFGKPEPYAVEAPKPQPMQNIEQKPGAPIVVPNGGIAYRNDDQQEMLGIFGATGQTPVGKSEISHLIELPEAYMASAKDFLTPVLRHHKLVGRPNAKGIIVDGMLTANALDALQNAVKALGATLGQTSGNIGQAIGKIRDLAQTFNPYALDGDGDGFVQDGSAFMRPYIPVKKPGFDLPDVRGRKRSGDALLDKPRSAPKLPKDKNTWTRAQRNEALAAGVIEPETREDVAYLANRRPDNEGIAKYWEMSEADLTKEGNQLVNARRQATGTEKERIDEELLKVSHEFQRRASYAETFGQEFVPPAKREAPEAMVPDADKPKPAKPGRTEAEGLASAGKVFDALNTDDLTDGKGYREWNDLSDNEKFDMFEEVQYDYLYDRYGGMGDDGLVDAMESGDYDDEILEHAEEVYNKIKAKREEEGDRAADAAMDRAREEDGFESRGDEEPDAEELASRERERALDEQADAALDRALEGYIERYGTDEFEDLSSEEQDAILEQGRDMARGLASRSAERRAAADKEVRDFIEQTDFSDNEEENDEIISEFVDQLSNDDQRDIYDAAGDLRDSGEGLSDKQKEVLGGIQSELENRWESAYMRQQERDREEYYGGDRPTQLRTIESQRDIDAAIAKYEEENMGFASGRREGEFGSNEKDSAAAKAFDSILEKYWKMWGFDVPDESEKGWDEPFGFASRGNDEEVKQSKLDELVGGVKDRLIAELETADPATWKPSWRNDSLPINPTTGKPYKGWNAFFLMLASHDRKYSTGRYAGFNQLKARGAIVRKGEKGIPILRPQLVKKEDEDGNVKEFVVFRGATVFNVDQTDGGDDALRAIPADLLESERIAILDETLKELGAVVRTENMTPHYSPDGDYISMPDFAKGTSALEWTSTLAHEAVHWTGHSSRLDRASLKDYSSDKKVRAYEELVAEIGSAMVLAAHGIEAPFRQDHAPYIKGWIQLLKDDPEALNKAFKDAQAAVNFMLEKSPNLRKLFGGLDNGKRVPEVEAPDKVDALVGADAGFASLHRVRTPGSEVITGILYDDNSNELMVGFMKGKSWNDLSDEEREGWIDRMNATRGQGGYEAPLSDSQIDDRAQEMYDDSREIGWYVYSGVGMEEVQELAAVKSKGRHINALKKIKKARKATDEDKFNFFGRDERAQDVVKAKPTSGFASRGGNENISVEKNQSGYWVLSAMVTGGRGASEENRGTRRMQITTVGGPRREALRNFRNRMEEQNLVFAGDDDGFASRGKKIGMEPRYQDREWINKTQERILRSGLDFQSLPENDKIDWVNSFLGEYLNENEMGHNLTDVANGRRLNTRPDIDLINYAEDAYARMSDAHMARRAQYGIDDDGFASVGRRTRRLGIKPSNAVDYVSYDPETENLFVAYKREDGRGDMYVYEGVSMDDAIGIENAESVGRAINDIKRRKNVRKATPEEVVGLSNADNMEQLRTIDSAMRSKKLDIVQQSIHSDDRFGLGKRESRIDEDGRLVIAEGPEAEGEQRLVVDWNPATGRFEVSVERWSSGDDVTPSGWETARSLTPFFDDGNGSIVREELLQLNRERELELDSEARIERELDDARRELDMAGDAPGVESVNVTYSSALDAVDYNPSTQELRVSYKDGGTYIYEGVDRDTFEGFKGSASKGRAMNDIKRAHPYRKDSEWTGGADEDGGIEEFDVRGSEAVEKVTYDPSKEELTVVYSGGKGYIYSGVTREEADAVRSAPSKGRAINDVKRTHDVRKAPTATKGAPDMEKGGWTKDADGKWSKGDFSIEILSDEDGNYAGLLATDRTTGEKYEQAFGAGNPSEHLDVFEGILRGLGDGKLGDEDRTIVVDPAPAPKPKMPTRRPPRGGKRVRNRNVVIEMEQGTLDEIIEAEGKKISVDELRNAAGSPMGKYTKGPRKGKNRGYDTITVRDAETGELLHANEILLTSSASPGSPSAANRKRGYIRARSYVGRQGHNVLKDEGPSLRGEGRGMTDYDKRVYGLGSDEKNREAGLASRGSDLKRNLQARLDEMIDRQEALDTSTPEGRREWERLEESIGILDDRILGMGEAMMARDGEGFASLGGDRGEDGYYTDYPRGEESSYKDYLAKLYEEADAALESGSVADYRDTKRILIEEGRLFGGPGDSTDDIEQAHREHYLDTFGLSEEEWQRARPATTDGDGLATRGYDPSKNLAPERWVGYGIDRYGNFSKEELLDGLELFYNRDQDEAKRIADYWEQSDALWDEYFETAIGDTEGDVERAFALAADRAYEDYLSDLEGSDGFASRSGVIQPNEMPKKPLVVQEEWIDFDELDAEAQDRIIQGSDKDRDTTIEQWDDDARAARAEAAESLLKEIDDLWRKDADADNPFQRNGNLAYAEELIKNTDYVSSFDLAEAQNIVDDVRERFNSRPQEPQQFYLDWDELSDVRKARVKEEYVEFLKGAGDPAGLSPDQITDGELEDFYAENVEIFDFYGTSIGDDGFASRGRDLDWEETKRGSGTWNAVGNNPRAFRGDSIYTITRDEDGKFGVDAVHGYSYQRDGGTDYDEEYFDETFDTLDEAKEFVRRIDDSREGEGDDYSDEGFASRGLNAVERDRLNEAMQRPVTESRSIEYEGDGGKEYFEVGEGPRSSEIAVNVENASRVDGKDFVGSTVTFADGRRGVVVEGYGPDIYLPDSVSFDEYGEPDDAPSFVGGFVRVAVTHDKNGPIAKPYILESAKFDLENDEGDFRIVDATTGSGPNNTPDAANDEATIDDTDKVGADLVAAIRNATTTDGEGFASRSAGTPTKTSLRKAATEKRAEIRSLIADQDMLDRENPMERRAYNDMEKRIEDAQRELYDLERQINGLPPRGDTGRPMPGEGLASRMTQADINDAMADAADYPDDYEADMANMARQELENNFARLSADDQNMYFQRALANNAESGMTTEQLVEEAKKLAMDDRRMAELERQSIGMGQSSKPRKIDVSSSSALNSVEYDEMNRRLSVEYRGRDGKGTGTVYAYDGVEPEMVDRIEASDSRGATMREIRDNYEFTTSRKLPDSAYEGLASRSETDRLNAWKPVRQDLRNLRDRVNGNEINDGLVGVRNMDVKPGSDFFRGRQRAYMGLMDELDEIIANAREEGNLDLVGPTDKSRARFESLVNAGKWVQARDHMVGEIANVRERASDSDSGFASRGGRRSTEQYQSMLDELPNLTAPSERPGRWYAPSRYSPSNDQGVRNATKDRYELIHARRQIAKEMADANGVAFNKNTTIYDVSPDEDDHAILEELDRRIDAFNELQTVRDREFLSVRQDEQVALARQGEAQDFVEYSQSLIDDDDQKSSAIDLLSDIQSSFGDEYFSAGSSRRDGGGGIHPSSKEIGDKIKQAKRLLESDDPEDTRSAIDLIREIADNYSDKFNADYYKAEAKQGELIDRGYRPVSVDDIEDFDLEDWDEWQEFVEDTGDNLSYIEDALYGPSQEELEMSVKYPRRRLREGDADGFASLGGADTFPDARINPPDDYYGGESLTSYEGGSGDNSIADYLAGKISRNINDNPSLDWVREVVALEYLPDSEPGSADSDALKKIADGKRITLADYEKLPNALKDEIDEWGNESGDYYTWMSSRNNGGDDGFASRGSRRRPGRRNQGGRGETMAPRRPWSAEDRQRFADGDRLRGRARPGKRRGGPDASEWDGFASTTDVDQVPDVAIDPRGIFEGGEHGPGKDISLRVMWNNIRRSGENNEWFEEGVTADDLAERLGVSRGIAQGLLDARPQSGGQEKFIDDPYLADRISRNIGISPERLFGFDPLQYFDESGRVPVEDEDIDAAIALERARRATRVAAREGRRTGKGSLYRSENGDVDVRVLEDKLNVKLTDENGNLLNAGALERATRDTGLGWGLEKWRRIYSRGGALTPLDVEQLVGRGILDRDALPSRDDLSFEEVFQWPGFSEFGSSQIIDALAETLGLDRAEVMQQRRSIQQALTNAKRGERRTLATRNLQRAKLKLSRAKIAELTERLGLDAGEFERWFGGE